MLQSGYVPLTARVDGLAFHATLFARAHVSAAGDAALPAKRTLFLLNVPPTTDEASLAAAFEAKAGDVACLLYTSPSPRDRG